MTYDPWAEIEAEEEERLNRQADADAEMARMEAYGNAMARAQRAGRCTHGSAQGYSGGPRSAQQEGLEPGQLRCAAGCGAVFASDDAWLAAMDKAVLGDG